MVEKGVESGQIGVEIRLLRELRKLSGKDLAELVGLSQSQLSRLESGQRRVDTTLLSKLARALSVHPSHFFRGFAGAAEASATDVELPSLVLPLEHVGQVVRSERRRRHLTAGELGKKLGKPRSWVLDVEAGAFDQLSGDLVLGLCRALKLEPSRLYDVQFSHLRALEDRARRLEQALAERARGRVEVQPGEARAGFPLLDLSEEPARVGVDGLPLGEALDYLYFPERAGARLFAMTHHGDAMQARGAQSFAAGETLVFSIDREVRQGEYALAFVDEARFLFRRVFFESRGRVRLQPLNLDYAPELVERDQIRRLYRLVTRVARF